MLLLTPRKITAVLLLCFSTLFGVKSATYFLQKIDHDQTGLVLDQMIDEYFPLLPWVERTDYDLHLRSYRPGPIAKDKIVIIDISERSIQKLGQFPFSRDIYARFLDRMSEAGAKSVAFDIVFSEPERNEALAELKALRREYEVKGGPLAPIDARIQALDNDDALAAAVRSSRVPLVMAFSFAGDEAIKKRAEAVAESQAKLLTAFSLFSSQVNQNAFSFDKTKDIPVLPHGELMAAISYPSTVGFFTASPDSDSVIRQTPIVMNFRGGFYGALPLLAVAQYYGLNFRDRDQAPKIVLDDGYWVRDEAGKIQIPLSATGSLHVAYYGGTQMFDYVEFADVMEGKDLDKIQGRIAFVGVTAMGLKDIRATPFSEDYPGVEVHATVASNILTNHYMVKDYRYHLVGFLTLLLGGLALSWCAFRLHPLQTFLFTLAAILSVQFLGQEFFFDQGVVVPTVLPCVEFLVILFAGILYRYFTQEKEKKYVRDALSRYVSGPVVEEILKDQTKLRLGGQKKRMTVMFCDMVGFTKLSEGLDAGVLTQLLNQFFTRMTNVILENHGTLDKYMGDAIMCFWGAPLDIPNHAELACKTALEMMRELHALNAEWKEKHGFTIGLRIGINTGEMSVGNMGSDQVFSYTVLGDNVNLGSRLEGVNNVYGTTVLVSGSTEEEARDAFAFRRIDRVQVKGKEEAVEVFELVGEASEKGSEWIRLFELGLESYRHAKWSEAEAAFKACVAQRENDAPAKVFLQRIEELKAWPPDAWDGVWKLASK